MKIITLSNNKGGVGKTAIAFNLAVLTNKKHKVLMIDLDPQCNSTSLFEPANGSMYEVFKGDMELSQAINHSERHDMDFIASNPKMKNIQIKNMRQLDKELRKLDYDYIFIDTPPALNDNTISAIISSDLVIIPMQLDLFSSQGLMNIVNVIRSNSNSNALVVPNQFVHNSKLHKNTYNNLSEFINTQDDIALSKPLPTSVAMSDTLADRQAIVQVKKYHKLSLALKSVYKEMINNVK